MFSNFYISKVIAMLVYVPLALLALGIYFYLEYPVYAIQTCLRIAWMPLHPWNILPLSEELRHKLYHCVFQVFNKACGFYWNIKRCICEFYEVMVFYVIFNLRREEGTNGQTFFQNRENRNGCSKSRKISLLHILVW